MSVLRFGFYCLVIVVLFCLILLFCIRADTLVFEGVEVTGYQIFEDSKVLKQYRYTPSVPY
jgi:hypothetical protein